MNLQEYIYFLPILSLILSFILYVPFINLLYRMKFIVDHSNEKTDLQGNKTPIFNKLHAHKIGTPIGGGILIFLITLLFSFSLKYLHKLDFNNILFVFISFGLLGFYDDLKKFFKLGSKKFMSFRARSKLLIQVMISSYVAYLFVQNIDSLTIIPGLLFLNNSILIFGLVMTTIVFYANAYNITDGLDGLSTGTLLISLIPTLIFLFIVKDISSFIFLMVLAGSALSYLYFNIKPARLMLGDAGALAFGATLAYIFLINDAFYLIPFVLFMFTVICLSSVIQILSKRFRGKKIFLSAPLHHHFEAIGWEESKVVSRFWVFQAIASLISVCLVLTLFT